MSNRTSRTAATIALLVLGAGMAGCDAKTASGTTTTAPRADRSGPAGPEAPGASLVSTRPEAGLVRVTGMVFRTGGDGTFPDQPYDEGTVAAIPLELFHRAQVRLNRSAPLGTGLRDRLPVPVDLLRADGVGATELGADGTYVFDVRPGPHALCLIELGGTRPPEAVPGTRWVEAWIEVDITDDELQTILPVYDRDSGEITLLR
jgi:hypothetical protein